MEGKVFLGLNKKEVLLVFPPAVGILFVFLVSLLFPEPGMIGGSILLSIMISIAPYAVWKYIRVKNIKAMEEQFPNFLRDLVGSTKSGMTLTEALRETSKNEYGKLNREIEKMSNQLSWNMSFDEVINSFADRVEESNIMSRSIKIIMEAKKSGGDMVSTIETVSSDVSTLIELDKKRKSELSQQAAIMYIIYFMFVVIAILLSKILVPMTTELGEAESPLMGEGGAICTPPMEMVEEFICSIFQSIGSMMGVGVGAGAYYEGVFLSMVLIQGLLSGLMIGQIRNDSATSGMKHSLIMVGVGLTVYIMAARYLTIEII